VRESGYVGGVRVYVCVFVCIRVLMDPSNVLLGSFAKVTCNFKEPANRSHPIAIDALNGVDGSI